MHPATPNADRATVEAVDELERNAAVLKTVMADLQKVRLPGHPLVEDRLDHMADLLTSVVSLLNRSTSCGSLANDFADILKADDARYSDDYAAENERAAANDDDNLVEAA